LIFVQDTAGTRLDIMLADTPYDIIAIERGRDIEMQPGITVRIYSPEDLIIWLQRFEGALDDSTLVDEYNRLRREQ